MVGVGWGISGLGEITRCPQTHVRDRVSRGVRHDDQDRLCLNGQPLILAEGSTYGADGTEYRTEVDTFVRVRAYGTGSVNINGGRFPTWFRVWYRDGRFEDFGRDPDARFYLTGSSSIHSWKLGRAYDRNNTFYRVTYNTANGYPVDITYSLNDNASGLSGDKKVEFIYNSGDRPDTRHNYIAGRKITMNKRLERIEVTQGSSTIRQYNLLYAGSTASLQRRSRITQITEIGQNNEAMPPIKIVWEPTSDGFVNSAAKDRAPDGLIDYYSYQAESGTFNQRFAAVKQINRGQWADMNGDGLLDLVIAYTTPGGSDVRKTWIRTPNTSAGWTEMAAYRLPDTLRSYADSVVNVHPARFSSGVINKGQLVDVNGDGLQDLVISYRLDRQRHQTKIANNATSDIVSVRKTYLNLNGRWQESSSYRAPDYIFDYLGRVFGQESRETTRGLFADINGDGLVDWLTSFHYRQQPSTSRRTAWINNGNGWTANASYAPPSYLKEWHGSHSWERAELVDVNGDGLQDWVEAYQTFFDGAPVYNTWLNTGRGWQRDNSFNLPEPIFDNNGTTGFAIRRGSFIDLNGDGLRDWVRSFLAFNINNIQQATRLNTGKGWRNDTAYKPPFVHLDYAFIGHRGNSGTETLGASWPVNTRGFYVDVNRDGLVDFVQSYRSVHNETNKTTWLNTGAGWGSPLSSGPFLAPELFFDYRGRDQAKSNFGQFIDINGDTGPDWVRARDDSAGIGTRLNRVGSADWVDTITTNMGVVVKPEFLPLTDNDTLYTKVPQDDNGDIAPEPDSFYIESPMYVVSRLQTSRADTAGFNTTEYRYTGLQAHRRGRGSLGFKERFELNVEKDIQNYTLYHQFFPYIGRPFMTGVTAGDDTLSASTIHYRQKALTHPSGKRTRFVDRQVTITNNYELGSDILVSNQTTASEFDDFGNELTNHTVVRDKDDVQISNVLTTNTYKGVANWLISLLEEQIIATRKAGQTGARTTLSRFTYDSRGRITFNTREPTLGVGTRLVSSFSYDQFGNLLTETQQGSGESRVQTITYDADNRLPATVTNAEGHVTTVTAYDRQCGQPTRAQDANGLLTTFDYDNFCRQIRETPPDGISVNTSYDIRQFSDSVTLTTTTRSRVLAPITTRVNKYGQPVEVSTRSIVNNEVLQRTEYDRYGRVLRESQPFFRGESEFYTRFQYDVLDRNRVTTFPFENDTGTREARIVSQYLVAPIDGFRITRTTDTKGRTTSTYTNAIGQVTRVADAMGKSIRYEYDSQGNLILTRDAKGNTIEVEYDILGRRTVLDDPDLGRSTFTYNAFGDTLTQTDAKGQTLTMKYDKLGRLTQRVLPGLPAEGGGTSTWTYDTADNGIGSKASVAGPNGYQKAYQYDSLARLKQEASTIKGDSFVEEYTYNGRGQLASRSFPGSTANYPFTFHYNYERGFLSSITGRANNRGDAYYYWRADAYDAQGRVWRESLANGKVTSNREYDSARGVLNRIVSQRYLGSNSENVQEIDYTWDTSGNMRSRKDGISGTNEFFSYDDLYRLTGYTRNATAVAPARDIEVKYDEIGNIIFKSDVGSYEYLPSGPNSVRPHAIHKITNLGFTDPLDTFTVNYQYNNQSLTTALPTISTVNSNYQIHNRVFEYDDNGNTRNSGHREVFWTAFDKPHTMITNQPRVDRNQRFGSQIEYGPDFERIYKKEVQFSALGQVIATHDSTIYVGDGYQRITDKNGKVIHRYTISAGNSSVQIDRQDDSGASIDDMKYMLTDALGSTNVILDSAGQVEQTLAFDPWGARLNTGDTSRVNGITDRGYTGQEADDESGLINMNARIYDPYLGKFLSADPVLPDPGDMQAYNRYAYVLNNPMKYTDPTGNFQVCVNGLCLDTQVTIDAIFGGGGGGGFFSDFESSGPLIVCIIGCDSLNDITDIFSEPSTEPSDGRVDEMGASGSDFASEIVNVLDERYRTGSTIIESGLINLDIAILGGAASRLTTRLGQDFFRRFIRGDGDNVTLSNEQFMAALAQIARGGVQSDGMIMDEGEGRTSRVYNFQFRARFNDSRIDVGIAESLGRARVFFDADGNAVGITDTFDFGAEDFRTGPMAILLGVVDRVGERAGAQEFIITGGICQPGNVGCF